MPLKTESHVQCLPPLPTQVKRKRASLSQNKMVLKGTEVTKGYERKRLKVEDLADGKVASAVIKRAEEVQANLAPEFPSMIKYMLKSHVTGGFWLGLPRSFCTSHLSKEDTTIILEDEFGKEYKTVYLAVKTGLSGGWRGFSIAHNLLEGDVIVFHLVEPSKFKVYIVRRNGSDEVDGALGLLQLEGSITQMEDNERALIVTTKVEDKCLVSLAHEIPEENTKNDSFNDKYETESDDSEIEDGTRLAIEDGTRLAIEDGIRLAETIVEFKDVKSIEDFTIVTNGLVIDSELSKHARTKYYELCCSQKSFLHDHILDGLNCRLVAGIISETINIADAIRASKLTTSRDDFKIWDKTLKAFSDMGMNVGFLCARLEKLVNFPLVSKRMEEAEVEKLCAEQEKKLLEGKLLDLNKKIIKLQSEIKTLEMDGDKLALMFKESASAPW
ncbi:hypothetical protein ACFE04_010925 [Oxalis oulophora]